MTEEELEKEAEKYFKSICGDYNEEYERTGKRHYWVGFDIKNAFLAGAEPREKRIAELEHQLTHRNCLDCSNHSSKLRMRTLELEKENAELKEKLEVVIALKDEEIGCIQTDFNTFKSKAKELFKWFVWYFREGSPNLVPYKHKVAEAEQFLNSEVEK